MSVPELASWTMTILWASQLIRTRKIVDSHGDAKFHFHPTAGRSKPVLSVYINEPTDRPTHQPRERIIYTFKFMKRPPSPTIIHVRTHKQHLAIAAMQENHAIFRCFFLVGPKECKVIFTLSKWNRGVWPMYVMHAEKRAKLYTTHNNI